MVLAPLMVASSAFFTKLKYIGGVWLGPKYLICLIRAQLENQGFSC